MVINSALPFVALISIATAAGAQDAPGPAIAVQALKDVTQTSSDASEGRKPTTPGDKKTTAYIVERLPYPAKVEPNLVVEFYSR